MSLSVDSVVIKKKIENCKTLQELEVIRLEYLGKKGLIPSEMKLLSKLPIDQKKIKGQELNKLKTFIEDEVNYHKILIENKKLEEKLKNESIDVTLPHNEEIIGKIPSKKGIKFNVFPRILFYSSYMTLLYTLRACLKWKNEKTSTMLVIFM